MYRLIFLNGRMKGRRVAVQQGTLVIGRDPSCQVDLADDDQVSREHASIEQRKDGIWIKDHGALNKTAVNGAAVDEVKLRHGDKIEIGRTQLEFQVIDATPVGARRRIGKVQVLTYAAIGAILALEAVFVFLFPSWQGEVVAPAAAPAAVATGAAPVTVEQEMEAARDRLQAAAAEDAASAAAATSIPPVAVEVEELRAAVAGLREQVEGLVAQTAAPAARAEAATAELTPEPPAAEAIPAAVTAEPPAAVVAAIEAPPPLREADPPEVATPAPPPRPAAEDPLLDRAKEMLARAEAEVARANFTGADQVLERIQVMAPEFVPAYVERARLFEKRGMLAQAGEQWSQVMNRTLGTPLYNEAAAERQRLARAEAAVPVRAAEERSAAARLPRRVRIVSVDRERFQGNKEFDEMRLVRVNLKPRLSEGAIYSGDVEILVTFYDRVAGKNEVVPSDATVQEQPLLVDGAWGAGEQKSVTATYIVPRGFRRDEQDITGDKRSYEGYRVQVFYKKELQDEDAMPRTLLQVPAPELSGAAAPLPANRPIPRR